MCEIEVACNTYEGIDAIKRALKEGESVSKPNCEVQVSYKAQYLNGQFQFPLV